jgi:hypothetical protein
MSMKIEVLIKIIDADGNESFEPVIVIGELPDFSEFTGPDNFLEIFDKVERTALKVRNKSMKQAIENYSSELSKKRI